MSKVAIIGNAGGGKSVLARQLGVVLGLPVYVIDDIQWQPGWRPTPTRVVAGTHAEWLAHPKWIIDGWGTWEMIERRFEQADTIVVVDFPLRTHYRWALQRQLLALLGITHGWPPAGCRTFPVTSKLLHVMRYIHRESRPRLLTLVSEPRFRDRVVYLHSPRELKRWKQQAVRLN
jgi:adenylate kinase family enzyme